VLFVGIAAIPQLGVLAVQLGFVERVIRTPYLGRWGSTLVILAVNFLALETAHAATTIAVSNLNIDRPASIGSSYWEVKASMRRSKALTYDRRGRIFVIYLLIVILTWVVKIVCQTPFYIILGLRTSRSPWLLNQTARLIQVGGTFLSASLIGALLTIAITL